MTVLISLLQGLFGWIRPPPPPPGGAWAEVIEAEVDPGVVTDPVLRGAIQATALPWRVRDRVTGIEMLLIPPGEFVMGKSENDDEAHENELPAHQVKLTTAFYLGRYEVTQQQYARVTKLTPSRFSHPAKPTVPTLEALMADGATKPQAEWAVTEAKEEFNAWVAQQSPASDAKGKEWPVEQVSWADCEAFCKKAGFRLPTEAEWEYACRAGTRTPIYGELGEIAWWEQNSNGETHAVGTKQANALGLHDMIGNVREWVNDLYDAYPFSWWQRLFRRLCGASNTLTNPTGPSSGAYRVLRGGGWDGDSEYCRASFRSNDLPVYSSSLIGFRVARTP